LACDGHFNRGDDVCFLIAVVNVCFGGKWAPRICAMIFALALWTGSRVIKKQSWLYQSWTNFSPKGRADGRYVVFLRHALGFL
jgi:hypothetical protein